MVKKVQKTQKAQKAQGASRSKAKSSPSLLDTTLAQLDAAGIHYACRQQAGSGTWQVFFFDPNGARVELDFDASERSS